MASTDVELEQQLKQAGKQLSHPPDSVDELLPVLDQVEKLLSKMYQSPKKSMQDALKPSMNALIEDGLSRHSDVDVKVAVASCISEITRITAPDAPYTDDQMRDVFQLIVSSFEHLADQSSRSYEKRASILETVSKVRSCVIMLDLECDALIVEMFGHFLKSVREYHSDALYSSMENIMVLVFEESEEISVEMLKPLLASVKKQSEGVLPVARKLGEGVLLKSAAKLRPYLMPALISLGDTVDNYSQVVASVCEVGTTATFEHNDENASGVQLVSHMVRSKALSIDIYEIFGRLPFEERKAMSRRPNNDYNARLAINMGRNIWPERGFNLGELAPTGIPATVANRGWGQYTQTPGPYHPDLVREFYAAMVPEAFHEFGIVTFRGRRVHITPDRINQFFGATPFQDLEINHGMPRHNFFGNNHDPRVAAALRRDGNPAWAPHVHDLRHSELHPELAIWGIFVKYSLLVSRNRTNVMNRDGHVLFAIQRGLDIDVGRVIFWEILNAGRQHGILPFPYLITHFCNLAQIPAASLNDELELPMGDINRRTYNTYCRPLGLDCLPTGRPARVRNRNQPQADNVQQQQVKQEEYEEPPEANAPPPPFEGQPMDHQPMDQQQWMQQMMAMTQANANSIASLSQDFSSFRSEYLADRTHYRDRVDAIYNMLGGPHSGTVYTRQPQGNDAGPSSQHPGSSSRHPGDHF